MKILTIISFLLLTTIPSNADVGKTDIFKVSIDNQTYYFKLGSRGNLRHSDLCYYNSTSAASYSGEVDVIVREVVEDHFKRGYPPKLYKALHVINTEKFSDYIGEEKLYLLKEPARKFTSREEINSMIFEDAFNGNTVGYIFTTDLNNADNLWIENNEIEKLFEVDYSECQIGVFAIRGKLSPLEITSLRQSFESIEKSQNKAFLTELHSRHIIKLGFCSC